MGLVMISTSSIVLVCLVILLLFLLIFISIGSNNQYKKHQSQILSYQDKIFHLKQENVRLKKESNIPKSQEFINFLNDFRKGGGILHIEPINKDDIYFHQSGK